MSLGQELLRKCKDIKKRKLKTTEKKRKNMAGDLKTLKKSWRKTKRVYLVYVKMYVNL